MTGEELRAWRERRNMERSEVAELLNNALGKRYTADTIARWETPSSGRNPPRYVEKMIEELTVAELGDHLGAQDPGGISPDDQPLGAQDTIPGGGGVAQVPAQPAVGGSNAWTKACEELWELIATGIGMVGAATGSHALIYDGQIIAADKEALGKAWGKLAETNETFRKMLVGMTEGGAWLQVAIVTGTTVSKCWNVHQQVAAGQRAARAAQDGGADVVDAAAA